MRIKVIETPPVPLPNYEELLAAQADKAKTVSEHRECPHCHQALTELERIALVNPGVVTWSRVVTRSGQKLAVATADVNPLTMLLVDR